MTENKRFTITICDNYRHILKDRDSTLSITLRGMSSEAEVELCDTLNSLHKENEELKKENEQLKHELLCKQLDKAPTEPINCKCYYKELKE